MRSKRGLTARFGAIFADEVELSDGGDPLALDQEISRFVEPLGGSSAPARRISSQFGTAASAAGATLASVSTITLPLRWSLRRHGTAVHWDPINRAKKLAGLY
jgi:hypothetical protein